MPIYEFACPKCRVIFNFLSRRMTPDGPPACPKCGNKRMVKQMSAFATPRASRSESAGAASSGSDEGDEPMPDFDDAKVMRAMGEMERDMAHLDENNPKHMAHMMRKMKEMLPQKMLPKELDVAIRRLESGEDPDKIEEDMGDVLGGLMGGEGDGDEGGGGMGGSPYSRDSGLYDYA